MVIAFLTGTNKGVHQHNPTATTPSADTTGTTLLIAAESFYNGGSSTVTSTPSGNNPTGLTAENGTADLECQIWYKTNPAASATQTVSETVAQLINLMQASFSGVDTTSPFDVEGGAHNLGAVTSLSASVTPTADDELVITVLALESSAVATVPSGYTSIYSQAGDGLATSGGCFVAYKVLTGQSGVAQTPQWTWTGGTSAAMRIATFKPAGSSPPVTSGMLMVF